MFCQNSITEPAAVVTESAQHGDKESAVAIATTSEPVAMAALFDVVEDSDSNASSDMLQMSEVITTTVVKTGSVTITTESSTNTCA